MYFDAGTGRGKGVEIKVTDARGENLLPVVLRRKQLTPFGTYELANVTNNYGELFACKAAMQIALKQESRRVFGDSALVVKYWSRGVYKKNQLGSETIKLIKATARVRKQFETKRGKLALISGGHNPADLGFHR